ncbi:hypothetical protein Daus18300_014218 [Diaporthe australafricana]|uniref:DUF6594 domain-containing protein n=1 Tax=Diaporthe australafricana TaxID=127596 RepID=A0ABR3VW66_9PEZI
MEFAGPTIGDPDIELEGLTIENPDIEFAGLTIGDPYPWTRFKYEGALIQRVPCGKGQEYRMFFSELQRMHVRKLQCKLAKHVVQMVLEEEDGEPPEWENDLQAFIQAVKDFKYMSATSQEQWDAFSLTSERPFENEIIQSALAKVQLLPNQFTEAPHRKSNEDTLDADRGLSLNKAYGRRLVIVLFASLFLLGPVWLMVLHNTLYTGLVSTTVFVIVFGLIMVESLDHERDVLSLTAAYAAVLVVFVGLNIES